MAHSLESKELVDFREMVSGLNNSQMAGPFSDIETTEPKYISTEIRDFCSGTPHFLLPYF